MPALRLVRTLAYQPPEPPAGDLIEQWSNYLTAYGCSAKTVDTYVRAVSGLMHHADVEPLELTRTHVIAWLGRPLKQWTRLSYWKAVRRFSAWLREFGHDPDSDLTRGIPKPRKPAPVARPVSDDLVDKLLALKLGPRAHVYVRLALFQALRVHEIAKLRGEDFNLESGWLMIAGKGGDTQPIPIHPEIAKLAANMPARGWWFPGQSGAGHVMGISVTAAIGTALEKCGSDATAHQLRDTCATRMQRMQGDIRVTQSMLRHRDINSTMKYTKTSNSDLQRAVRTLDWGDHAQPPVTLGAPGHQAPVPDLSTMDTDQLRDLAAQLVAVLQARTE